MIASAIIEAMAETNNASDHSLLWGYALEFWDRLGIWSLIAGAIVGVVALLLTAASAYILYRVADVAQVELSAETKRSSERIEAAQADIAKANARIAEADARTKEAELELRKQIAPRALGPKFTEAIRGQPGCPVLISYVPDAGDTYNLAMQLHLMLPSENGWVLESPEAITEQVRQRILRQWFPAGPPPMFDLPGTVALHGHTTGITVVVGPGGSP